MFRDLRVVSYLARIGQRNLALPTIARSFASDSVFVRNVSPSASTEDLKQFMERSGQVVSCVIPQSFGQNKGYGFVQFASEEQAQKAIAELNNSTFFDQVVELSEKRAPPKDTKKIFVRGLPQTEWEQVQNHFQKFGTVTSCKTFTRDDQAVSAIVEFESEESASRAIAQKVDDFNGSEVTISTYVVKKQKPRQDYKNDSSRTFAERTNDNDDSATRVYVSNVDTSVKFGELKDFFSSVGEVKFVRINKDRFSNEPNGSALIQFQDREGAKAAVRQLNQASFRNANLTVRPFRARPTQV